MEKVLLIVGVIWFGLGGLAGLGLAALNVRDRLRRKPPRQASRASS